MELENLDLSALNKIIVSANSENDIALLKEIFLEKRVEDIKKITDFDKFNYLHRILCYFEPTVELVKFYIENGVPVNAQDRYGMTPLHYAMQYKNVDAAMALVNAGADPNIPNRDNLIPLRMCIRYPERLDLLDLMLKNGGNVHYFDGNKELLQAIKDFKGNDPDPKYALFIQKLEQYA